MQEPAPGSTPVQGKALKEASGDHGEEGAGSGGGNWALKESLAGLGEAVSGLPNWGKG